MNIASWNCHNLNSAWNTQKHNNRIDYVHYLCEKIQQNELDVIFLAEVEDDFPKNERNKIFFLACRNLDESWNRMTSGIYFCASEHIKVENCETLLPGKDANESEYGFALRTRLRDTRNNEQLDLVTVWNTIRKEKPRHGYPATFSFLLQKLGNEFFDSKTPHLIIGDFNMTADEIYKKLSAFRNVCVGVHENTQFPSFDMSSSGKGNSIDHVIYDSSVEVRFMGENGKTTDSFCKSVGFIKRNDFVKKGISDHLPLYIQTFNPKIFCFFKKIVIYSESAASRTKDVQCPDVKYMKKRSKNYGHKSKTNSSGFHSGKTGWKHRQHQEF